jgi:hypothetical protein
MVVLDHSERLAIFLSAALTPGFGHTGDVIRPQHGESPTAASRLQRG